MWSPHQRDMRLALGSTVQYKDKIAEEASSSIEYIVINRTPVSPGVGQTVEPHCSTIFSTLACMMTYKEVDI